MNLRPETIKLLADNTEGKYHNIGLDEFFLTPKAKAVEVKINP